MNNKSHQSFRDQLLEREQLNPVYKQKYEKEVKAMIERKLTGVRKWSHIIALIMGVGFFILFGVLAVVIPKELPILARLGFVASAIFGLAIVIVESRILKKGTINLKEDPMTMAGMGWGFIVILATFVLVFSGRLPDRLVAVQMLASVLVYEIAAAAMLLRAFIERSELKTREKLLGIEYRLVEISEQLKKK
ncbi:hypothetical protein KAS42_05350 [bacterium]|nr:hypothetical protein [bacterium]